MRGVKARCPGTSGRQSGFTEVREVANVKGGHQDSSAIGVGRLLLLRPQALDGKPCKRELVGVTLPRRLATGTRGLPSGTLWKTPSAYATTQAVA